jgi:hypothetical protein
MFSGFSLQHFLVYGTRSHCLHQLINIRNFRHTGSLEENLGTYKSFEWFTFENNTFVRILAFPYAKSALPSFQSKKHVQGLFD